MLEFSFILASAKKRTSEAMKEIKHGKKFLWSGHANFLVT
jgi:hypothetical protein